MTLTRSSARQTDTRLRASPGLLISSLPHSRPAADALSLPAIRNLKLSSGRMGRANSVRQLKHSMIERRNIRPTLALCIAPIELLDAGFDVLPDVRLEQIIEASPVSPPGAARCRRQAVLARHWARQPWPSSEFPPDHERCDRVCDCVHLPRKRCDLDRSRIGEKRILQEWDRGCWQTRRQ